MDRTAHQVAADPGGFLYALLRSDDAHGGEIQRRGRSLFGAEHIGAGERVVRDVVLNLVRRAADAPVRYLDSQADVIDGGDEFLRRDLANIEIASQKKDNPALRLGAEQPLS